MVTEKRIRTFVCEGCGKEFTLNYEGEKLVSKPPEGLEHWREVFANNGTKYGYCGGACESKAALAGKHDFVGAPKVLAASEQDAQVMKRAADTMRELIVKG
jgi:hypothetical protein